MVKKRIVVTGMGVVSPVGVGKNQYYNGLLKARPAARPIAIFKPFDQYHNLACQVMNLDFTRYLGNMGLKRMDRSTKLLAVAAKLAFKDAKLDIKKYNSDIGVVVGTDWAHCESNMHFHNTILTEGPSQVSPMDFSATLANSAASQLSIKYGLAALNATIARGFTSGVDAIGYASNMIKNHGIRFILTGAVESLSKELYAIFYNLGWLFSLQTRKGVILGEGACLLMLEEIKSAQRRKAKILAEVIGYGFSFGNNKESMQQSVLSALADAKLNPSDIDCLSLNLNGNINKDKSEIKMIQEVFGKNNKPSRSSIKTIVGEGLGVSSMFQVASICLSRIRIGMVNSFGLDGNNACLILKRPV